MKHISYGESEFLTGDDAAETLVEYAVLMARSGSSDAVTISVLSPSGDPEEATFVIGPASQLVIATTKSTLPEPDNAVSIADVKERIGYKTSPPVPISPSETAPSLVELDDI